MIFRAVTAGCFAVLVLAAVSLSGCGSKAEMAPPDVVSGAYPQLPWPPPKPTSRFLVPAGLITSGAGDTLGRAFTRLTSACSDAGLDWSAYAIDTTGFAIVSELDSIAEDGTPRAAEDGSKHGVEVGGRGNLFARIIQRLFGASPGRYRVIVFAVTGKPMAFAADTLSRSGAEQLLASGETYIPEDLARAVLGPNTRCEALIYEFWRPSEVDTAAWVGFGRSRIKPVQHLVRSGLWPEGALR